MRRLVFLVVLLATSGPAFAEQRLFVRMPHEVVELDPRPASVGTVVRRFALPENARTWLTGRTYVVGGGDYLAWMTGYLPSGQRIVVLDTRTGTVHLIPAPGVYLERVLGTDGVGRVVFLASGATPNLLVAVADARTASLRVIDIGNPVGFTQPVAYAPESDLLFVGRARGIGPDNILDVDVIHLASGGLVKTLDLAPVSADVLETDDGGARLFVTDALNGTFVFDVASARRLAANTADDAVKSAFRSPALDEIRNRLIVNIEPTLSGFGDAIGISAFSADTLQFLGRIRLPELPLPPPTPLTAPGQTQVLDIHGLSTTAFVLQAAYVGERHGTTTCRESRLITFDAGTGQLRALVDTTDSLGPQACFADLARATEPEAPHRGTADVAGRRVTLRWSQSLGATSYEVEAGLASGRTDLTIPVADPQLVIDAVPPGVYYVRVRAVNARGRSLPTAEARVVVP
jgi:hypothetical protein